MHQREISAGEARSEGWHCTTAPCQPRRLMKTTIYGRKTGGGSGGRRQRRWRCIYSMNEAGRGCTTLGEKVLTSRFQRLISFLIKFSWSLSGRNTSRVG